MADLLKRALALPVEARAALAGSLADTPTTQARKTRRRRGRKRWPRASNHWTLVRPRLSLGPRCEAGWPQNYRTVSKLIEFHEEASAEPESAFDWYLTRSK